MINISTILNLTIGGKILLKDTQLTISDGEHYGLIGKNGIGKTTLLNYILTNPKLNHTGISDIYMVSQEIEPSDDSVLNYILNKNIKRTEMLNEYNKIMNEINNGNTDDKLMEEMEKIIEQMNYYEFQKDESKVRKILTYLGFTIKEQDNPVKLFSGGWRMRISLATALYMKPELLLLDEPTNHLDLEACIWLTEYLSEWKKTLIIVSHDVNFLNKICTQIIYVNGETKKLKYYKGNYRQYLKMKYNDDTNLEKEWQKLDKKIDEMKKKSIKRELMEDLIIKTNLDPRPKPYRIIIEFPEVGIVNGNIINCQNITYSYTPNKILFKDISFGVGMDSRITFVGKNGIGKSTLMKLLLNKLKPQVGEIIRDSRIRIEYFEQHCIQDLPFDLTPIEYLLSIDPKLGYHDIRKLLGKIGLSGELHNNKLETFSGGQKVRVALIAIQIKKPHIIILDEPTNHLDIETIDALIKGINEFNGGLLMITHDIRLITETNSILYQITEDGINETTYDEYHDEILNEI